MAYLVQGDMDKGKELLLAALDLYVKFTNNKYREEIGKFEPKMDFIQNQSDDLSKIFQIIQRD
jgi:hypothetical protein